MTNIFVPKLLIVLHETVVDCETLLSYHQSPNFKSSYHACIDREGTIVNLVPPKLKAYAANNSRFINQDNEVEEIDGSVDDFSFHISLETPVDGRDKDLLNHSGYTKKQYESLAWLISKTGVPNERIVSHDKVKLNKNNNCKDPRTFNKAFLIELLGKHKREREIDLGFFND